MNLRFRNKTHNLLVKNKQTNLNEIRVFIHGREKI